MRRSCALVLLVLFSWIGGLGQDARAGVTIDVVFQDAIVPTGITLLPGDPDAPGCLFGGYWGGGVSTGRCADVMMSSTDELTFFSVSVTYDNDDDGLKLGSMYEWRGVGVSFGKSGNPLVNCAPAGGLVDNGGIFQSFDCAITEPNNPPVLPAGTYRIGTIVWDTSGFGVVDGGWDFAVDVIAAYIDASVDGFTAVRNGNIVDISSEVVLGAHILAIIPEPGTAGLLGLGLVGLVLIARRRRD